MTRGASCRDACPWRLPGLPSNGALFLIQRSSQQARTRKKMRVYNVDDVRNVVNVTAGTNRRAFARSSDACRTPHDAGRRPQAQKEQHWHRCRLGPERALVASPDGHV